jgi:hypothetical protein
VYDRVSHIETAHDVWLKLPNTYEGSSEIKSSCRDTYNRQYQNFSQKPGESLDDCFTRLESIVSSLCSCGPLAYSDNEHAKQLLYALDDHVWGMKITALEESASFATLDTEKLFSKLTNTTVSSALEFALSSLYASSDEQYESMPDDKIALLARKFCALHKFRKERRKLPRGYFDYGDTTPFNANCPKRKKLDSSSNKYNYTKRNDYDMGDDKKKHRFGDKKKKFQKMMS